MTNISLSTVVSGSGPAIVLAHGAGGGIDANFGSLIPLLRERHTVIGSDYPADDTPLDLDALADALVDAAVDSGADDFTLIGYSLGSAVAIRAATRYPERVRALILAAGFARADHRARATAELWQRTIAAGDAGSFARVILLAGFSAEFTNALDPQQITDMIDQATTDIPGGVVAQAALVAAADVTADLPALSVPTLVIAATEDLLVDPANSRDLAARIPGAEYTEIPAGHVLMLEHPDAWHTTILDFLTRHELDLPATATR
ncbi:alpha/beta fold hydrolase [Nocardia sp. NPDC057668]|uniref:alpha/beta fold hydrolase n=1 Tax=Nocardia sp. NPDC057668 TaxID=3346202 RepID=UPI00366E1B82